MNRNIRRILKDVQEIHNEPIPSIHYRHDEENVMKGYAVIIGPSGTPYEDGFYMFDFTFPDDYPFQPPKLKFMTYDGVTRFNPNLYISGEVCLSVLNTWSGEQWSACQSIRTILLTIMTLILNDKPLTNEPFMHFDDVHINNYNQYLEFKNIDTAILKYLEQSNIPAGFEPFHAIFLQLFSSNYQRLLERIKDRPNEYITFPSNVVMPSCGSVYLNYNRLVQKLTLVYNNECRPTKPPTFPL